MNGDLAPRSRGFWLAGFVVLLLLHAAAIFRFGERKAPPRPTPRPAAFLHVGAEAGWNSQLSALIASRDPTLFALPHPESFSGSAWRRYEPEMPRLTNWSAPREWLALPAEHLAAALREHLRTNPPVAVPRAGMGRSPGEIEVRLPGEPLLTGSTVRVEGRLAARPLERQPPLPPAAHPDVLRPTVVTVAVNGDGVVETTALLAESGSVHADLRALDLARQFQFRPLPVRDARLRESLPPEAGRLVFQWQVLAATNPPAAPASPP